MSNITRYEKELAQRLKNLALPDKESAWGKMEQLLDGGDNGRTPIPPPPNNRNNNSWNILLVSLLVLVAGFWFYHHSAKNNQITNNNKTQPIENDNHLADATESGVKKSKVAKEGLTTSKNNFNSTVNDNSLSQKENTVTEKNNATNNKDLQVENGTIKSNTLDNNKISNTNQQQKSFASSRDTKLSLPNSSTTELGKQVHQETVYYPTRKNNAAINKNDEPGPTTKTNDQNSTEQKRDITTAKKSGAKRKHIAIGSAGYGFTRNSTNNNRRNSYKPNRRNNKLVLPEKNESAAIVDHSAKKDKTTITPLAENDETGLTKAKNIRNKNSAKTRRNITTTKKLGTKSHVTAGLAEDEPVDDSTNEDKAFKPNKNISKPIAPKKSQPTATIDRSAKKDTATIKPLVKSTKDPSALVKKKDNNSKKKKAHFAVGITEQQPIRLNCNCIYPNSNATSMVQAQDYVPSVYVRYYSAKKWFLQAELKYAAPQYVQDFVYRSGIQNLPYNFIDTSYILKKAYFHQLHISFDYFVVPNWSVGVGAIYNLASSEASEKDIAKKMYGGPDSLISSTIIRGKDNPSFATLSNNIQALIESEYKWKRFSFGARYTIGLQPYVKYNVPLSGQPAQKTTNSMNVFFRFELR